MNLLDECAEREAARQRAEWGDIGHQGIPGVKRYVAAIVADVLDVLSQDGRVQPPVPPGPCWNDSGITARSGDFTYRCELLAGHDGAHTCEHNDGGTAVWPDDFAAPTAPSTTDPATQEAAHG